ncbi:hypothetical protein [Gillisia hiemivivida]|uniref:Lipoprotein n=1 Tax=Gillisia hiemivivida TaxID=291190 RepID=A0A5C6ZY09_9FLAO|nr:hypothetical protein [Gillisia hiemivivida]TXD95805.1 hypothetical protein ES724_01915 [Gillisia hiemivivida]
MIKDVELKDKTLTLKWFSLSIVIFSILFLGCEEKEKIYLDYNEAILNSNYQIKSNETNFFYLYNKEDTIYLEEIETETHEIDYINRVSITPTGAAITKLLINTFENTTPEKNVELPRIFIMKKDFKKNKLKIIEAKQRVIIIRDNFQ